MVRRDMQERLLDLTEGDEAAEIILMRPPRWIRASVYLMAGLLLAGLTWSFLARVETYISAPGVVRPKGDLVRVQPLVGGRLLAVNVKEGETVAEGAVLFRIDGEEVQAALDKVISRLEAQEKQLASHRSSMEQLINLQALEAIRDEIEVERTEWELKKAQSRKEQVAALLNEGEARVADAEAQFKRAEQLFKDQLISREEFDQKEAGLRVARAILHNGEASLKTADHEITLLERDRDLKKQQASTAEEERKRTIQDFETKILILEQEKAEFRLEKEKLENDLLDFLVRAPRAGTITRLLNRATGEVVETGDTLALLAPEGVPWIVEALVSNQDAGPLQGKVGNTVRMKFDAYPYRDFGTVEGKLVAVSPDATVHDRLGRVYRVEAGLDSLILGRGHRKGRIELGMTAQVEILKEKERILSLLFRGARDRIAID